MQWYRTRSHSVKKKGWGWSCSNSPQSLRHSHNCLTDLTRQNSRSYHNWPQSYCAIAPSGLVRKGLSYTVREGARQRFGLSPTGGHLGSNSTILNWCFTWASKDWGFMNFPLRFFKNHSWLLHKGLALKLLHFAEILEKLEKRKRNKNINRLVVFPANRTFHVEVTPSLGFNSYFQTGAHLARSEDARTQVAS